MISTFHPGTRVLWREPFHQRQRPAVVIGPSDWPWLRLIAIRICGGPMVLVRRDRLVRR